MDPKTKKYLIYGGVAAGGILLLLRMRHNANPKPVVVEKPKQMTAAEIAAQAPSTTGQYSPVGYYPPPQTYNPYPVSSYPSYIPPGPSYIPPYTPPITGYYPGQYPNYPQPQPYQPPYQPYNQAAICASVIGMGQGAAIQRLRSFNMQGVVVSNNGRMTNTNYSGYGPNIAQLYIVRGVVSNAVCGGTGVVPTPSTAYSAPITQTQTYPQTQSYDGGNVSQIPAGY